MIKTIKNVLIIFFSIFYPLIVSAQDTWMTEIPYETNDGSNAVSDLIKTNDDGFLVLIREIIEEEFDVSYHSLYKYDSEGQLEWEQHYNFGVSTPVPDNIYGGGHPFEAVQLDNNNYFMTGLYEDSDTTFFYSLITDTNGDSLFFNQITGFSNLNPINGNVFSLTSDSFSNAAINKFSISGQIIEQIPLNDIEVHKMIINSESDVFTSYSVGADKIKKFDLNGNLSSAIILPSNYQVKFLSLNEENGVTAFDKDLIKLDADLNEIWVVPFEDIFPTMNSNTFNARDIIYTEDQGYVIAGNRCDGFFPCQVYLIKYDLSGNWEWGNVFSPDFLPLEYILKVVEVEDGFVFVGAQETTKKIRLIKLNKQGLFTSTTAFLDRLNHKILIYPNPANEFLTIDFFNNFTGLLSISNIHGQTLSTEQIKGENSITKSIIDYPSGYYIITGTDVKLNQSFVLPFVKQ